METLATIEKRASLKTHLSTRDVEQEKIAKILEAAVLAPSARNSQPWRFIVVKGRENVEAVVDKAFMGMNQVVKEAPALIIACANPSDDDIHEGREYYLFDVGLAVENMLLAATDLGLVTHPLGHARETLRLEIGRHRQVQVRREQLAIDLFVQRRFHLRFEHACVSFRS